jgi:hypothetical protein
MTVDEKDFALVHRRSSSIGKAVNWFAAFHCAKTVPESNVFKPFELTLSEKQIP